MQIWLKDPALQIGPSIVLFAIMAALPTPIVWNQRHRAADPAFLHWKSKDMYDTYKLNTP